jgi:polyisoprenoid-binding protein YceI
MKRGLWAFLIILALMLAPQQVKAEEYVIDTKNSHAFIQFKIPHLGYSMLLGRFNKFEGSFTFDKENPSNSKVSVTIDTASIDSNNPKRDKHLRSDDFLDVKKFPTATFLSTGLKITGKETATLKGKLTLHGVTRKIDIEIKQIGTGKDPWGGYRRGFEGRTDLKLSDYDIDFDLGPASKSVELYLSIEGIRQ